MPGCQQKKIENEVPAEKIFDTEIIITPKGFEKAVEEPAKTNRFSIFSVDSFRTAPEPEEKAELSAEEIVAAMKESIQSGSLKEFTFEQVLKWENGEKEENIIMKMFRKEPE